jgi:hypothetical protein
VDNDKLTEIEITANGMEAYKESFYLVENRKGRLDGTEYFPFSRKLEKI